MIMKWPSSSKKSSSCQLLLLLLLASSSFLSLETYAFTLKSNGIITTTKSAATGRRRRPTGPETFTSTRTKTLYDGEYWKLAASAYVPPEQSNENNDASQRNLKKKKKSLHPKIGDIVRYYDLDGGMAKGQLLVGKITFLTKVASSSTSSSWLAEVTELEDVGDGYYAEYSSIANRNRKKTDRKLEYVSPIMASFVRSEQAYKVPISSVDGTPKVVQETYDIDDFEGIVSQVDEEVVKQDGVLYNELKINLLKNAAITGVIGTLIVDLVKGQEDAIIFLAGSLASIGYLFFLSIKTDTVGSPDRKLGSNVSNLRFVMPVLVILGVALYNKFLNVDLIAASNTIASTTNVDAMTATTTSTAVDSTINSMVDAATNSAAAGVGTDEVTSAASSSSASTSIAANIAAAAASRRTATVIDGASTDVIEMEVLNPSNPFDTITVEQFGSAMLGFLTYRIPLFLGQIQEAFKEENAGDNDLSSMLPGSAGVALQMASQQQQQTKGTSALSSLSNDDENLIPVLLVSGPQATGRPELVDRLLNEWNNDKNGDDDGTTYLVRPNVIDRVKDPITFERLENRQEILQYLDDDDESRRYGITKDSIFEAATTTATDDMNDDNEKKKVVVVIDANVNVVKELQSKLIGTRIIGVWVGLETTQEFETRIKQDIADGKLKINVEEEETESSLIRARMKEIISEIEYGLLSSNIFEFTIFNSSEDRALKELKDAVKYC